MLASSWSYLFKFKCKENIINGIIFRDFFSKMPPLYLSFIQYVLKTTHYVLCTGITNKQNMVLVH